jgi:hypothetical protein
MKTVAAVVHDGAALKTNNANDANRANDRRAVGVAAAVGVVEDGTAATWAPASSAGRHGAVWPSAGAKFRSPPSAVSTDVGQAFRSPDEGAFGGA